MQQAAAFVPKIIRMAGPTPGVPSTPEPACPICKGMGWVHPNEESYELVRCACAVQALAAKQFVASGLADGEYAHMRLATYRPHPTYPQQEKALA
jgi:hypothetical protein